MKIRTPQAYGFVRTDPVLGQVFRDLPSLLSSPGQSLPLAIDRVLDPRAARAASRYRRRRHSGRAAPDGFYASEAWRRLRYKVIRKHGGACQACKRTNVPLHVDHIKPRRRFPELQLVEANLQVLCEDCNLGKGAWDQTDWRPVR